MAKSRNRSKKRQTQGEAGESAEATAAPARPRLTVSNTEFVQAFLDCTSFVELAERLSTTDTAVANRANRLRKMGVNLPQYARRNGRAPINVDALNELIDANATE